MPLPDQIASPFKAMLVGQGFSERRRGLWERAVADGIAAIQFTPPRPALFPFLSFTAHLGFYSHRLAAIFGPETYRVVGPDSQHWYRWIGYLGDDDQGAVSSPWEVDPGDEQAVRDLVEVVEARGVGTLRAVGSDTGIRDSWLESADPWLHRSTQAAYLVVLVDALGPEALLADLRLDVERLAANGGSDAAAALAAIRGDPT